MTLEVLKNFDLLHQKVKKILIRFKQSLFEQNEVMNPTDLSMGQKAFP